MSGWVALRRWLPEAVVTWFVTYFADRNAVGAAMGAGKQVSKTSPTLPAPASTWADGIFGRHTDRRALTYDDATDSVACFTSTNMPHELHG